MTPNDFAASIAKLNRKEWFKAVCKRYARIAIVGGPRAGKTTLSRLARDRSVIHTDDFRARSWEAVPHAVIADVLDLAKDTNKYIVEGVQVARCLRKGLEVDVVVVLMDPIEALSPRQEGMRKGVVTVLADWYKDHKDTPLLQAPAVTDAEKNEEDADV